MPDNMSTYTLEYSHILAPCCIGVCTPGLLNYIGSEIPGVSAPWSKGLDLALDIHISIEVLLDTSSSTGNQYIISSTLWEYLISLFYVVCKSSRVGWVFCVEVFIASVVAKCWDSRITNKSFKEIMRLTVATDILVDLTPTNQQILCSQPKMSKCHSVATHTAPAVLKVTGMDCPIE